jgi:superfamily II DNA or RNA helicase
VRAYTTPDTQFRAAMHKNPWYKRSDGMLTLRFAQGTLELVGPADDLPESWRWDPRSASHRAPAICYAETVRHLRARGLAYDDQARAYATLQVASLVRRQPRPYQTEALSAWLAADRRGVVVLPTGAGKTQVAMMAIERAQRATLVVVPTLDLVRQWYDLLRTCFGEPIGLIGGGEHDVQPITVSTYDSAYMKMEHLGARFGLIVFDECHHLPSIAYAQSAQLALAPFRLGLTATPERQDGKEAELTRLVGPTVYRRDIVEMSGDWLAAYDTERIEVELLPEERREWDAERALYRGFVAANGIRMASPEGWGQFVMLSSRSADGQRAMRAFRRQRELAYCASAKLSYTEHLLHEHRRDRVLVFTQDNATAYRVARRFLIPCITHQTKVRERSDVLSGLGEGRYGAIVTSKVLNEGVDLPDASVAIVMSGSGSVREHVQRLGRILRRKDDKRALLYELVTASTGETFTSERRREHSAYR